MDDVRPNIFVCTKSIFVRALWYMIYGLLFVPVLVDGALCTPSWSSCRMLTYRRHGSTAGPIYFVVGSLDIFFSSVLWNIQIFVFYLWWRYFDWWFLSTNFLLFVTTLKFWFDCVHLNTFELLEFRMQTVSDQSSFNTNLHAISTNRRHNRRFYLVTPLRNLLFQKNRKLLIDGFFPIFARFFYIWDWSKSRFKWIN